MPPPTYRITTLGCRANFAETRELETILRDRGLVRAAPDAPADLEVVHTCSVTHQAARKSRAAIRRVRRRQRDRLHADNLITTGCFAGTDPRDAARLSGGADRVLAHDDDDGRTMVDRFAARVDNWLRSGHAEERIRSRPRTSSKPALTLPVVDPAGGAGRHIRAELKIQDGCDAFCTFCIIPKIRRTLRSKSVPDAVEEASRLVDLGHREIVLTGIFIGAYGHETALRRRQADPHAEHLADLLDAVARVPGLHRLRLSSMEPGDLTPTLLDAMVANRPVVVPHLHLPLQSGSDDVLKRMNRQYRVGEYRDMIHMANQALTHARLPPAITTDVICGFPGETDEDFDRTLALVREVGYLHLHVFPFSPRQGTAAARWNDRFVPHETVKARVRSLIDLEHDPDNGLSIRYRRRLRGRHARVILERPDPDDPARMTGRCDRYALLTLDPAEDGRPVGARGDLLDVRITNITPERTHGRLLDRRVSLPLLT